MRALLIAFSCLFMASSWVTSAAAEGEKKFPEISESHRAAAEQLILTADPGDLFAMWTEDQFRAKLGAAYKDVKPGSKDAHFLEAVLDLGGQARAKLLEMHSILIAREMSEDDLNEVTALYEAGMEEEAVLKTKPGKKWRKALLKTSEDRIAAVTVVEHKWIEALTPAYNRIYKE